MSSGQQAAHHTIYRVLLHLYPRSFRREYGGLMTQAFSERLAERGTGPTWLAIAEDLSVSVPQQAMRETLMNQRWLAEVAVLVAVAMVAATTIGAGSPLLLIGIGIALVPVFALWTAAPITAAVGSPRTGTTSKRWTWWTCLATALASTYFVAGVLQAVNDPKPTNLGALVLLTGFALLVWAGLILRSRSGVSGHWMVMLGMLPGLMFFWLVIPTLIAIAIIIGAGLEIAKRS